jgi:translation initiation factor 2 beta subunit (eIF-2beta)/eIF-5
MLERLGFKKVGSFEINRKKRRKIKFIAGDASDYKKPGVYVLCENNTIKYVGECENFRKRMRNYEIPPKGAQTSERISKLIHKSILNDNKIFVYFLEERAITKLKVRLFNKRDKILSVKKPDRKLLERILINKFKPEWNKE